MNKLSSEDPIRIFLLEDESNALEYLMQLIEHELKNVKIVGHSDSVEEAFQLFQSPQFDVLITDIRLKDGLVFDLLQKLKNIPFAIIFTSTHQDYGFQAIQFAAVDYLLKPFDGQQLKKAFQLALKQVLFQTELQQKYSVLLSNYFNKHDFIFVINKYSQQSIPINEIMYIEAASNYCIIHAESGNFTLSKTLKEVEELIQFKTDCMLRIHKSHLVNIQYVTFHKKLFSKRYVQLKNGLELEISKRKWTEIKLALNLNKTK